MLTIAGLVLVAVGVLSVLFISSARWATQIAALLVIAGTGLQVYEAWAKLPPQCRALSTAASCMFAQAEVKPKRR
jgi:disulfide bond formation protein DsbB